MTDRDLMQPEPPCKTGSQCVGGKCDRCAEPEPVAWRYWGFNAMDEPSWVYSDEWNPLYPKMKAIPLYTAPPQREWQSLTDEEIDEAHETTISFHGFALAIEQALKEKNYE